MKILDYIQVRSVLGMYVTNQKSKDLGGAGVFMVEPYIGVNPLGKLHWTSTNYRWILLK